MDVIEKLDDRRVDKLEEYATQQKIDAIKEQLECYGQEHLAEVGRISKILAKSSAKIFRVSIKYNVSGNLDGLVEIGVIEPV